MKLNRVLSTFVLTGLLSGATMVAQAQTHIFFGFGGGRGPAVAVRYYRPPCPGPGFVWIAGYYNGPYWVPGYWVRRGDDDGYYAGGYYGYYGRSYYRGEDDWRDRGWRGGDRGWRGDDRGWRGDDHHDRGWHRGWDRGRRHDH